MEQIRYLAGEKVKIIDDGNLTWRACTASIVVGIGISYVTFKCAPPSIWSALSALSGFFLMAVGGLCSRARMLHIKPFDSSYRRARRSYEVRDDKQDTL